MKVIKFGGTSVGTPDSLRNVKKIVEGIDGQVVVVVSALGGITDHLISTARLASQGDMTYLQSYAQIVERHLKVIDEVVKPACKAKVKSRINQLFEELGNIFWAICLLRDFSPRTYDIVVSFGERMSSLIVSNMIEDAKYFHSPDFIITNKQFDKHILDNEETTQRVHETFDGAEFKVAIVPGFISNDRNGDITNLGRGGSDYTAAIIAGIMGADILEIWTDVDGFMTADPRIVKNAFVMDRMTFAEAMELCNFGAKVIYPPTLYPVYHKSIPIKVKNTFNPDAPGTLISTSEMAESSLKGISYIKDISIVRIPVKDTAADLNLNERIFNALAQNGISIFLVENVETTKPAAELNIAVKSDDAKRAGEVLSQEFSTELRNGAIRGIYTVSDMSLIAVVGHDIDEPTGRRVSDGLAAAGLEIKSHNIGSADTNISVIVDREKMNDALVGIHSILFED